MFNKIRLLFLVLLSINMALFGQGRVKDFGLSKGDLLEDLLFNYYDNHSFNGSILVVEDGKVIYENTFGFADFESEEPLDQKIPFYLASLSKQFTAAAILKLNEEGKLSLDDPITRFLPLLPSRYDDVNIRHLLTHTAGVPDYFSLGIIKSGLTNLDVYKALLPRNLEFRPGYKFRYSNSGYVLLALTIQVASGKTIDRYFQENIFDKFNMENAFVYTADTKLRPRVKGYTSRNKADDYDLLTVGDGGIYATALDLYKWLKVLNSGQYISQETLGQLYEPLLLHNGRTRNYAFGWETGSNLQGKLVYHSGGLAGFRSYIENQLETKNSIIILTNNSFSDILELRNTIVKILDGRIDSIEKDL